MTTPRPQRWLLVIKRDRHVQHYYIPIGTLRCTLAININLRSMISTGDYASLLKQMLHFAFLCFFEEYLQHEDSGRVQTRQIIFRLKILSLLWQVNVQLVVYIYLILRVAFVDKQVLRINEKKLTEFDCSTPKIVSRTEELEYFKKSATMFERRKLFINFKQAMSFWRAFFNFMH